MLEQCSSNILMQSPEICSLISIRSSYAKIRSGGDYHEEFCYACSQLSDSTVDKELQYQYSDRPSG